MALLKKKKRNEAEIPTSSMADIAFLLLIFFLVTTTIDVDTGRAREEAQAAVDSVKSLIERVKQGRERS